MAIHSRFSRSKARSRSAVRAWVVVLVLLGIASTFAAQAQTPESVVLDAGWEADAPALSSLVEFDRNTSEMRVALIRYLEDRAAIQRRYEVQYSPVRRERLRTFYRNWQRRLAELDFDALSQEGQIDYVLLRNRLEFELEMLDIEERRWQEIEPLVPFADDLRMLQEDRHDRKDIDPRAAAAVLDAAAQQMEQFTNALTEGRPDEQIFQTDVTPIVAHRAANYLEHLDEVLDDWNQYHHGYHPEYTWWATEPYDRLTEELDGYVEAIRRHLAGVEPDEPDPIVGDPVGAEGLQAHLKVEMIPYTPEELLAIGWREFEWIEEQFRNVSREMGFGEDWQDALSYVKDQHPPPGEKPRAIFDIAAYSEEFLEEMEAITVPPLAKEVWRLAMQAPERQQVNPFFTGGEVTRVSYPTDGMSHEDKLMSMRGNSPHLNFATVHHELIPGHHLQGFMSSRFNSHRGRLMRTPFWGEGWALYWEFQLWDADFPRSNEDRIGMLFWRMHRAARIIFSLNYQLENWTAQEAVDFLVERVGFERANAEAEVRRTALAPPLYQLAYKIGGLQFMALYEELVEDGPMTAREYHDAVLQGGRMPVELVRARITGQSLTPDYEASWRFEGDPLE